MDGESKGKSEKELRAKVRSVPGSQGVKILKGSLSLSCSRSCGEEEREKVSSGAQPSRIILFRKTQRAAPKSTIFLSFSLSATESFLSLSLSCSLAERVYTILTRDSSKLYSASTMTMMMMMLFS